MCVSIGILQKIITIEIWSSEEEVMEDYLLEEAKSLNLYNIWTVILNNLKSGKLLAYYISFPKRYYT